MPVEYILQAVVNPDTGTTTYTIISPGESPFADIKPQIQLFNKIKTIEIHHNAMPMIPDDIIYADY